MIGNFSCFTSSCRKQVKFACSCTVPETMMCKIHKLNHLKGKKHHKIRNFQLEDRQVSIEEDVFRILNSERLWLEKIKMILTQNFEQPLQDLLRIKLLYLEESMSEIDKLAKAFKKISNIESRISAEEIIQREVYKNKDNLADLILNEKKTHIDAFAQKLTFRSSNNAVQRSQLLSELYQLSHFDEYENYIFSIVTPNSRTKKSYKKFIKECENLYLLLDKPDLKILKQHSHILFNTDFNYLYSYVDNYNGIELYAYDIESHKMTIKSYRPNHRLLDSITNIVKISKSSILILGILAGHAKGFIMDLGNKNVRQIFQSKVQTGPFHELNEFICYENYLFVFGCKGIQNCMKMNLNSKRWQQMKFPYLHDRIFSVFLKNYALISCYRNSNFYLYDFLIEGYSEISDFKYIKRKKFLFTDNLRVYMWIWGSIYESEEDNPFKWNLIADFKFGIHAEPNGITYSNYMGNLYIGFLISPQMYCFKFNRTKKEMELIYQEDVNN
ncbi:unnamed protein product [Blepharisma stoltei]|uniref:Uncharacterized protein n=1 Tax=Blepharisma stoltei TaxID=1481888 RepID=A0AAU9K754_9CILI|nr:unnamed protein product [Blepharisma stoltei]